MTNRKTQKKNGCRGTLTARGRMMEAALIVEFWYGEIHSAVHTPGKSRGAKGTTTLDVTIPLEKLDQFVLSCVEKRWTFVSEHDLRAAAAG